MSLYFDYKVQSPDPAGININIEWHLQHPLIAVASYSQERGGFVTIFDELGDPLQDVTFPQHPVAQVTSMAWHPMKKVLATGWENGELRVWVGETEFMNVQSPHQMPITILDWSEQGGRLVSGDTSGSLVGWKIDPRGQILTVFHSELKDPLIHIVFRRSQPKTPGFDISGLAKAAVAGDEQALDMFSAWRPRTAGQRFNFQASQGDNMCFFIGSVSGLLFYFNEDGTCTEVLSTDGSVLKKLLYHDRKDNLIVMTEGLNIGQFAVDVSGALSEITKVKLSGRSQDASMVWAGPGLLAVSTGDLSIRCWDMDTGENYVLEYTSVSSSSMANNNSGNTSTLPTEIFTSLAFTASKGLLCGGTNHGNIIMWKYNQQVASGLEPDCGADPAQAWQLEAPSNVRGAVKQLGWGSANSLLAVNTITNVFILKEQLLCSAYGQQVSAVQVSPNRLLVEVLATSITGQKRHSLDLKTDLQVKGVAVSAKHVAVWSNKTLVVYQLCTEGIGDDVKTTSKVVGTFSCEVESAVMFEQSLIVLSEETIHLRTFQGTVKQNLILTDTEGQPLSMELCGSFLTVSTTAGVVKLWDLSRREAKPHAQPKILDEEISDFGEIIMAKCNSNGSKVSISIAKSNFIPDPKLFIWDIDTDSVQYFNFATGKLDIQETEELSVTPVSSAASVRSRTQRMANYNVNTEFDCAGRFVLSHHWDAEEPKLLVCEAKLLPKTSNNKEGPGWSKRISSSTVAVMADVDSKQQGNDSVSEIILVTFFTTPEQGLIIQDIMSLSRNYTGLLGVQTPNYLLLKKLSDQDAKNQMVDLVVMRDFEGLEAADKPTRDAVLNFSYNLTIGNMDEAFRAIKTIRSEAVWESLARMCVKTKRLDVAWVCLGHMKHARGAMALRQASKEPEMEARVGMLAVQLGLVEEAERLYISCGRYDLLNQLYQASGEWDKALRVAEEQDRIHLRTTYFNYASHLESKGDFPGAAHMYERSDTHRFQVPRMLLDDQLSLESYVLKSKDPQLVKWWAQYMESTGQMDLALQYYEEAHDYYSLVRVLCFQENLERASEVASTTGDRAACYHLARQYEALGKISEAVQFFTRAQAYGNAVRICKEHGLEDQLWTLALLAGSREQVEAAQYFECGGDRSSPDKAVILYHRAGMLHKALDLAFRTQQYNALQHIAVDLNSNSDPALIEKCARFFVENKQFQKAVDLLAVGKQYVEALNLCLEHRIPVTEDLAEKLTMPKGEGDEETRVHVLEKIAETLLAQGNYHLATKKFAQAGNKIKALKALLKSGDTERIIFFASVSRQKEIYIMAANYLQSLDWKSNPEVLKNIVTFYTKGKALELLANFYVACAQVEVDEYQNYEKAYGALSEASRCLAKVTEPNNPQQHERTVENLNRRMALVRRFVDIRRMMERSEAESGLEACRQMLQDYTEENSELEAAVRKGDIYALMVEYVVGKGDFQGAHKLIEEFRHSTPNVNLPFYLGTAILEKVARGVGLPLSVIAPTPPKEDKLVFGRHTSHDEEEEEEGEVVDEVFEEGHEDEPSSPFKFMNGSAFAI